MVGVARQNAQMIPGRRIPPIEAHRAQERDARRLRLALREFDHAARSPGFAPQSRRERFFADNGGEGRQRARVVIRQIGGLAVHQPRLRGVGAQRQRLGRSRIRAGHVAELVADERQLQARLEIRRAFRGRRGEMRRRGRGILLAEGLEALGDVRRTVVDATDRRAVRLGTSRPITAANQENKKKKRRNRKKKSVHRRSFLPAGKRAWSCIL